MTPTLRQLIEGATPLRIGPDREDNIRRAEKCRAARKEIAARMASPEVALAVLEALEGSEKELAECFIVHARKESLAVRYKVLAAVAFLNAQAQPSPAP